MAHYARDVLRTSLTQAVMIGAGVMAGILTARELGPDGRGLYSLGVSIRDTAIVFGGLELGAALIYTRGQKPGGDAQIVGAGLVAPFFLGVITLLGIALCWPLLSEPLKLLPQDLLVLSIVLIPVTLIGMAIRQVFRALDDFDNFNRLRVFAAVARLSALTLAFLLGGYVRAALIALLVSEAIVIAIGVFMLLRRTRPDFVGGVRLLPGILRFGLKLESASALGYASVRISVFAIAYYLDADAIAFYTVADGLVQQIAGLPMIVATVLLPKISGVTEESRAELTAITHRVIFLSLAIIAVVVWSLSQWVVVGLYGVAYAPAVAILGVLLPAMVFQSGSRVLAPYLVAVNRIYIQVLIQAVSLAVHVTLLVLWIPTMGILGVAWALAAGAAVRWILYLVAVAFSAKISVFRILVFNMSDARRISAAAQEQLRFAKS
ncbi:MAG: oligosaccharide flippase family protein [Myxococcota bacterium]|nr:oligosaccharide flippase family protein [Myxococcota bacterium]